MEADIQGEAWQFAGFLLDLPNGGLFRLAEDGTREPVVIGSRALELLLALVSRPGELVAKQTLIDAVWPGVAVEEKNLPVQISALRRVLDQGRAGESCIQTVAGRGYRLAVPTNRVHRTAQQVTPAMALPPRSDQALFPGRGDHPVRPPPLNDMPLDGVQPGSAHSPSPNPEPPPIYRQIRGHPKTALAALALIALAASTTFILRHPAATGGPATSPRLSIVVLPFQNLSGIPAEDYLAEAITDDLTTNLSRFPGTIVIARQTAYTYQGRSADVRPVGQELGVRYALKGSVRKVGDALRVNAQLIDTNTGAHVWADRFDGRREDLSAGQDDIAGRIVQTVNPALFQAESARRSRERPANPDAFDLILRARSIGMHLMGRQEHALRLDLFEQALRLDPTSFHAMIGAAGELARRALQADLGADLTRAVRLVADATAINPNDFYVMDVAAWVMFARGRYDESAAAYQRLLDRYPNANSAHNQIALCLIYGGRAEEAAPVVEMLIRQDPRSPYLYSRYDTLGHALLMLGRDEEAITATRRALATAPQDYLPHRSRYNLRLAASLARLGRLDEARRAVAEANRLWPYDTVRSHWPEDPSNAIYVAQMERYQEALRLAGHRDHAEEDAGFGIASDATLPENLAGPTPATVPGAKTIQTAELAAWLSEQNRTMRKPVIIDLMMNSWGRSIPGAIGLRNAGIGGPGANAVQDRLRQKMRDLTGGDLSTLIVAVGFNAERFDGRNLVLQLVALGYTGVHWYRGGREAWEVAGQPETETDLQDW